MTSRIKNTLLKFLPLGFAITLTVGLSYVFVQQNYRQSLNDPQIQIVTDAAAKLEAGKRSYDVVKVPANPGDLINIETSLSPFVAVYSPEDSLLQTDGAIGADLPNPPKGVFEYAKIYGEDVVTWQPNASTRIALVVKSVNAPKSDVESIGFVVSGRNMKEVESRIDNLTKMMFLGLFFTLLATFAISFVVNTL